MSIAVDGSKWPVINVVYSDRLLEADLVPFVDTLRTLMWAHPPATHCAVISDLRKLSVSASTAKTRGMLAEELANFEKQRIERGGPIVVADARVTDSAVVRGFSIALEWVRGSHDPIRYFASLEEAQTWVHEALGLPK